jgi:hypothetical protein
MPGTLWIGIADLNIHNKLLCFLIAYFSQVPYAFKGQVQLPQHLFILTFAA